MIKIEQQKPITKNDPAPIKKEEPKPMIKVNNNPIAKNEPLPSVNEIVKAKDNKEVNKPNNFKDRLNNFQNAAQKPANEVKKAEPPKNPGIANMLKNFENQNNKEENKLKPHQPLDDDSVKGKSTKNYRL